MKENNIFSFLKEMQTGNQSHEWWQTFQYPETPNFEPNKLINCARSALFGTALANNQSVHEANFYTINWSENMADKLSDVIKKTFGGRLAYNQTITRHRNKKVVGLSDVTEASCELFFIFSGGAIAISTIGVQATIKIVSLSPGPAGHHSHADLFRKISESINEQMAPL